MDVATNVTVFFVTGTLGAFPALASYRADFVGRLTSPTSGIRYRLVGEAAVLLKYNPNNRLSGISLKNPSAANLTLDI